MGLCQIQAEYDIEAPSAVLLTQAASYQMSFFESVFFQGRNMGKGSVLSGRQKKM